MSDLAERHPHQEAAPAATARWIGRFAERRFALPAFAVLFAASLAFHLSQYVNHDVGWYLHSAGAFLDGGRLYQDIFFEVNPPLALYLTLPPVMVARLTGLFAADLFILYVFALAGLSLLLARRLLRAVPDLPRHAARGLLLAALIVLLVIPARDFGQREHLMVALALPYLLLAALRALDGACERPQAALIGVLAGLGFALKPHFLLVPLALEIYLLLRARRLGACFRSETLALAATLLLYGLAILIFTPDYLTRVVPFALEVYNGAYRNPLSYVLFRQEMVLLAIGLFLHLAARRGPAFKELADVFFIAATGFILVFVVQMKGWNYQLYPAASMLLLGAATLLPGGSAQGNATGHTTRRSALIVLTAVLLASSLVGKALLRGGYENHYIADFAPYVERHAAGGSIYVFSTNVSAGFPLATYSRVGWSSRFSALWLIPGLERKRRAQAEGKAEANTAILREIERFAKDAVIEDFTRRPPDLVLVDKRREKSYFGGTAFDYLDYFRVDPRFREIWSDYTLAADLGTYRLYRRK